MFALHGKHEFDFLRKRPIKNRSVVFAIPDKDNRVRFKIGGLPGFIVPIIFHVEIVPFKFDPLDDDQDRAVESVRHERRFFRERIFDRRVSVPGLQGDFFFPKGIQGQSGPVLVEQEKRIIADKRLERFEKPRKIKFPDPRLGFGVRPAEVVGHVVFIGNHDLIVVGQHDNDLSVGQIGRCVIGGKRVRPLYRRHIAGNKHASGKGDDDSDQEFFIEIHEGIPPILTCALHLNSPSGHRWLCRYSIREYAVIVVVSLPRRRAGDEVKVTGAPCPYIRSNLIR